VAIRDGVPIADLAPTRLLALFAFHRSEPHFPRIRLSAKRAVSQQDSRSAPVRASNNPSVASANPPEGSPAIHVQHTVGKMSTPFVGQTILHSFLDADGTSRSGPEAHVRPLYVGRLLRPAIRIALLRRTDEHFERARPYLTAAGELAFTRAILPIETPPGRVRSSPRHKASGTRTLRMETKQATLIPSGHSPA
jgi:hypothetical protein